MHKRLQRVLTALAITGLVTPSTLATTTGTAAADTPGAIATVQACVAAARNPASSLPACSALAAQLTGIFAATPAGVSPIVDQIETTVETSAFQTLGGVLADADNCVNGTDATCASVAQTVVNVEQALVLLAQREENLLLAFTQDCVANTNATCHAAFDDIQTLINLSEQEAAFVAVTATECLSAASTGTVQVPTDQIIVGGVPEPSCATLLGQLPALLGAIGVVVGDLQACIAGTNATPCQTAEQAVAGVLSNITNNLAKLLQGAEECASGSNPTCAAAVGTINQTAAAIQQAVNDCAAQTPGNTCSTVIAQVAQAVTNTGGVVLACSGISADSSCAPLEASGKLITPMIGDQDTTVGLSEVTTDSTTGDVMVGNGGVSTVTLPAFEVTPPQLPGTDNLTTEVGLDTFDTQADALAVGDLNAAATATNSKGGCDESSSSGTQPDYVYQGVPVDGGDKNTSIHYNFVRYQINVARNFVDGNGNTEPTWQLNDCMYGGARAYHRYRLWLTSGGLVEYPQGSPQTAAQIAYAYNNADDASLSQDSLDFKLDLGRVLTISPHIGQNATGHDRGAPFTPPPYYDQKSDPLYQLSKSNEVQGWWREYHSWYVPRSHAGSTDFQGSALSGLFEFGKVTQPSSEAAIADYYYRFCALANGC